LIRCGSFRGASRGPDLDFDLRTLSATFPRALSIVSYAKVPNPSPLPCNPNLLHAASLLEQTRVSMTSARTRTSHLDSWTPFFGLTSCIYSLAYSLRIDRHPHLVHRHRHPTGRTRVSCPPPSPSGSRRCQFKSHPSHLANPFEFRAFQPRADLVSFRFVSSCAPRLVIITTTTTTTTIREKHFFSWTLQFDQRRFEKKRALRNPGFGEGKRSNGSN
jgi:hypothetical protein